MKLLVDRFYKGTKYTVGKLYIDGKYICDTMEDKDRGLTQDMPLDEIKKKKVYSLTAIPTGTYTITLDLVSPKFSKYPFYMETCGGKLPRLQNVKGYSGILIHVGDGNNGADKTLGCILVGYNKIKGGLLNGKECFSTIMNILRNVPNDENITITIK